MRVFDAVAHGWEVLSTLSGQGQQALFESLVQPMLFQLGLASYLEDAYEATGWLLAGLAQIAVMLAVIGPLQRWRPAETLPTDPAERARRRAAVRVDVIYTLIDRLGLLRVVLFFAVDPLWNAAFGWLSVQGVDGWDLDQWLAPAWPGVTDSALFGFLAYVVVLDFVNYVMHRLQHRWAWWWALHAVHHSQRHMTMWTDSRNHLLDTLITSSVFVLVARVIGVPPGQFIALVVLSRLVENLSHANLRLGFGWLGDRLLVGPRFHRLHHGMGIGHEGAVQGTLGGCNFAVLFPLWDLVLRTARYGCEPGPTGIRDQLPAEGGRDYGRGFWAQQGLALARRFGDRAAAANEATMPSQRTEALRR